MHWEPAPFGALGWLTVVDWAKLLAGWSLSNIFCNGVPPISVVCGWRCVDLHLFLKLGHHVWLWSGYPLMILYDSRWRNKTLPLTCILNICFGIPVGLLLCFGVRVSLSHSRVFCRGSGRRTLNFQFRSCSAGALQVSGVARWYRQNLNFSCLVFCRGV